MSMSLPATYICSVSRQLVLLDQHQLTSEDALSEQQLYPLVIGAIAGAQHVVTTHYCELHVSRMSPLLALLES